MHTHCHKVSVKLSIEGSFKYRQFVTKIRESKMARGGSGSGSNNSSSNLIVSEANVRRALHHKMPLDGFRRECVIKVAAIAEHIASKVADRIAAELEVTGGGKHGSSAAAAIAFPVNANGSKKLAHGTNAVPRHVMLAIKNDPLLATLFDSVHIGACGFQMPSKELDALAMVIKRNRANNESKRRKGKRQRSRARTFKNATASAAAAAAVVVDDAALSTVPVVTAAAAVAVDDAK